MVISVIAMLIASQGSFVRHPFTGPGKVNVNPTGRQVTAAMKTLTVSPRISAGTHRSRKRLMVSRHASNCGHEKSVAFLAGSKKAASQHRKTINRTVKYAMRD